MKAKFSDSATGRAAKTSGEGERGMGRRRFVFLAASPLVVAAYAVRGGSAAKTLLSSPHTIPPAMHAINITILFFVLNVAFLFSFCIKYTHAYPFKRSTYSTKNYQDQMS